MSWLLSGDDVDIMVPHWVTIIYLAWGVGRGGWQKVQSVCRTYIKLTFKMHSNIECSVQFSSVAQLCPTLCGIMNRSTPGLPVHHQLLELTQTHAHWVGDAIQPSVVPFSSRLQSFPASGLFQGVSSSHQEDKVLEFQLQHQSFQWVFRTDFL